MPNQVDLAPSSSNSLHVHVPNGASASGFNNVTDFPSNTAQTGAANTKKIVTSNGIVVRFANPS